MDYAACNVVYVDRAAARDHIVKRDDAMPTASTDDEETDGDGRGHGRGHRQRHAPPRHCGLVDANLQTLLATFSEVHVCASGKSCVATLSDLNQASMGELIPTLVLLDIPYDDQLVERPARETRTPSPSSRQQAEDGPCEEPTYEEAYGLTLLQWIATEIQYQSLSRLVVPVAVVSIPEPHPAVASRPRSASTSTAAPARKRSRIAMPLDQTRTVKCLDMGAVDVLTSPLLRERLPSLAIHAYRAHKDALKEHRALLEMKRGRKRSWVGVDDLKPYAYLREAMVSGLMDGICKLGGDDEPFAHVRISISLNRREVIAAAVGSWHFSAHDFTDDELLHAALLMLQHALAMPELEKWRLSTENLTGFLVASRSAYNAFVPYHNFRHVVDVLQACFHFLVRLGRLPPYPASSHGPGPALSPIAALIRPFDALTLLIAAIGHDVGHPGVNNAFLVTLNAPLAQLYNDRSVLESFHCAAYSQILRRHWPVAFQGVEMRQLMTGTILATDMGLHFDYMKRLGFLQEKLHANGGGTDGWNGRYLEEQRTLACSLLIKCADISNVARNYDVAAQWTMILTDEFARQATMETDLGIPTALFAAPVREIVELGKSQVGFMNMFALPLFQGVTDIMPAMSFCVEELQRNKSCWEVRIAEEQERVRRCSDASSRWREGTFSPRSMSLATPPDADRQRTSSADTNLRKALLSKSPFNVGPDEAAAGDSPPGYGSRRSSKPSQLQLSFSTASPPERRDRPSRNSSLNGGPRGTPVTPSLVTDAVVIDPPTPRSAGPRTHESEPQRSSDGTGSSNSNAGDWASQATSATTGKMPLSPSTQGTSFMSDSEDRGTATRSPITTPTGTPRGCGRSDTTQGSRSDDGDSPEHKLAGSVTSPGSGLGKLKKKPSRFRMSFWKRSKSASPPVRSVSAGGEEGPGVGP